MTITIGRELIWFENKWGLPILEQRFEPGNPEKVFEQYMKNVKVNSGLTARDFRI